MDEVLHTAAGATRGQVAAGASPGASPPPAPARRIQLLRAARRCAQRPSAVQRPPLRLAAPFPPHAGTRATCPQGLSEREEQLEKKKLLLEKKINDEVRGQRAAWVRAAAQRAAASRPAGVTATASARLSPRQMERPSLRAAAY